MGVRVRTDSRVCLSNCSWFNLLFGVAGAVAIFGQWRTPALMGDKGYRNVPMHGSSTDSICEAKLLLTGSAAAADADDADQANPAQVAAALARRNVVVHRRHSPHRAVIERVIGMMKRVSHFVAGPVFQRSDAQLGAVLFITATIVNRLISVNQQLFVRGAGGAMDMDVDVE